jgi:acyl-CoA reductase-like NAD-dependent aldehyde dehydrogenase
MTIQNGSAVPPVGPGDPARGRTLPVRNPYTGEVDYQITPPSPEELPATCDALRAAQVKWAAAPLEHRTEVLLRWADELDKAYGR